MTISQALKWGISAHKEGKLDEAANFYSAILTAKPEHSDANHNMGIILVQKGSFIEAITFFRNAIDSNSQVEQYWVSYISALTRIGRTNNAKNLILEAKSNGMRSAAFDSLLEAIRNLDEKHQFLIDLLKKNKLTEALDAATNLCSIHTHNANFASVLGVTNFKLKNYAQALEQYELALRLDAFAVDAYFNQGICQKQLDKLNDALSLFLKAIIIEPDFVLAYQEFGNLLLEMGRTEPSVSIHSKAVCLPSKQDASFFSLGTSFLSAGEYKLAEKNFAKAIEVKGDDIASHMKLAQLQQNAGDILSSIKSFKKAVLLSPEDDNYLDLLGNVLIKNAQYYEATQVLNWSTSAYSEFRLLECLYKENKFELIEERIKTLAQNKSCINLDVAAFSAFFSKVCGKDDKYPFCPNPFNYLQFEHLSQYITDSEQFIQELIVEIESEKQSWQPFDRPVHIGHQTIRNLFDSTKPKIRLLSKLIHKSLGKFFSNYQSDTDWLFTRRPPHFFLEGWSVNLLKGGYQDNHSHPGGWISGILYLEVVANPFDNEGSIEFNLNCLPETEYALKEPKFIYQPKAGDIILFPSSLFHRTIPVVSDVNRRIVSFDFRPS